MVELAVRIRRVTSFTLSPEARTKLDALKKLWNSTNASDVADKCILRTFDAEMKKISNRQRYQ